MPRKRKRFASNCRQCSNPIMVAEEKRKDGGNFCNVSCSNRFHRNGFKKGHSVLSSWKEAAAIANHARRGVRRFPDRIHRSEVNEIIRRGVQYKEWRKAVFERDDYTCQECGAMGVRLNADHIKPFALYPDLRFDVANGRTLCVECHRKTPTYGFNKRYVKSQ